MKKLGGYSASKHIIGLYESILINFDTYAMNVQIKLFATDKSKMLFDHLNETINHMRNVLSFALKLVTPITF